MAATSSAASTAAGRLHLEHAEDGRVDDGRDLRVRPLAEARAARHERDATDAAGRVAQPRDAVAGVVGRAHLGEHDPVRPEVERAVDPQPLHRGDAHDRGGRRSLDREQLGVEVRDRSHAVLEVDDQPVVARPRDQLRGGRRAEVDERADRPLPGEHAPAQVAARREGRGGWQAAGRHRPMMQDAARSRLSRSGRGRRRPSGRRGRRRRPPRTTRRGRPPGRCGWARRRRPRRSAAGAPPRGQRHHPVVVVQLVDDRARPRGDRAVALHERGQVLGQRLGAGVEDRAPGPSPRRRSPRRPPRARRPPIAPSATCWRSPSAYVPARISVTRPAADSVRVGVAPADTTATSKPAASSARPPLERRRPRRAPRRPPPPGR